MILFCTVSMTSSRRSGMSSTRMSRMLGFEPAPTGAALAARGRRPVALNATPAAAPSLRASLRLNGVSIRHLLLVEFWSSTRLRVGVARQEDVSTVVVVRHAVGRGVAGAVRRNAPIRCGVPGVEGDIPAHIGAHNGVVGGHPDMRARRHGARWHVRERRDPNGLGGAQAVRGNPQVVVWTVLVRRLARDGVVRYPATVDRATEIYARARPLRVYHVVRNRDVTIRGGYAHRVARRREREVVVGVREGQPPAGRVHRDDLEVAAHSPALVKGEPSTLRVL